MPESTSVGEMAVSTFSADTVVLVDPQANLLEVADALTGGDVGLVVVGEAVKPQGVVSERDLVSALARRLPPESTTALDVATKDLLWCDAAASVAEVAEEMCENYVRHVLVEDEGKLVGIVSARDLLGVYAAADMDPEI